MSTDIHGDQQALHFGAALEDAKQVVILLHGRGASAQSMLPLAESLATGKTGFLLPQAALNRWYPNTAFGPLEANEPDLTSALKAVDRLVEESRAKGFSDGQIALVRAYERRGVTFSDRVLLDRATLLERLKNGKKFKKLCIKNLNLTSMIYLVRKRMRQLPEKREKGLHRLET